MESVGNFEKHYYSVSNFAERLFKFLSFKSEPADFIVLPGDSKVSAFS